MMEYYLTILRQYIKLQYNYFCKFEEKATKDDLMGVEDKVGRGMFHKTTLKHKGTVFSIDTRGEVLSSLLEAPIIVPHTASASKTRVNTGDINLYYITCVFFHYYIL